MPAAILREDGIGPCETVNCGRGAALSQFNLRVSKVFRLPYGMNIEAIAEGFNLFNRTRFSTPNTNLSSTSFGQVRAQANSPRNLQLALKLIW